MELTSCVRGERIVLTDTCSQTFIGMIKSVNTDLGRLVLTDMVQIPENKLIMGYRNFDKNEIVELKKYEGDNSGDNEQCGEKEELEQQESCERKFAELKKLQNEYRYVRDFGTNFHSAMSLIKACSRIGVIGKDISKGRFGRASVLAISTPSNIFLFDLKALGDDVLVKGLKEVLESPSIVKIVHDSRLLSDCFKHKHLICFENVRDVEAEDIMTVFQDRRIIRRHFRSLEYLTLVYLGVKTKSCNEVGEVWDERPLPPDLLERLVCSVSYLIPLQEEIERKYLQKLIDASNVYNNYVRSLNFFDFLHYEPKETLRKQLSELLITQTQTRTERRLSKIS